MVNIGTHAIGQMERGTVAGCNNLINISSTNLQYHT
jgi:hypothetical protein